MATYKATANVTIGSGELTNTNENSRWASSNRFVIGDTAELTEAQAKQYAAYFKKASTSKSKEKKASKNK